MQTGGNVILDLGSVERREGKGKKWRKLEIYMRENKQGYFKCENVMEWEVSTKILRILLYTTENTLLTFIEIGNTE